MSIVIPSLLAGDIMQRDVVTLGETWDVREALALLTERRISGAPVIDGDGDLVGVLSLTDLARLHDASPAKARRDESDFYRTTSPADAPPEPPAADRLSGITVRDAMTPIVIDADARTPIEKLAGIMIDLRVHRVIITREGKLAGIVTSMDLLRVLREGAQQA